MNLPLVSLITPTYNRRGFIERSIKVFERYDYPHLEWIILDDGDEPILDLLPDDTRIKYAFGAQKKNHGQKMDECCGYARGSFCVVHDDDDVYPADRIERVLAPMFLDDKIMLTGTSSLYYYDHGTTNAYLYQSPVGWLGAIAFRKAAWEQMKFEDKPNGADWTFQRKLECHDMKDPNLVVAAIHGSNAAPKKNDGNYKPIPWDTVKDKLCIK